VKTAFKRLVNLVPRRGRIVAFDGAPNVSECVSHAFCAVERYGFQPESFWRLADLHYADNASHWQLLHNGQFFADLTLPMAGEHNALNATAAATLAAGQGIAASAIAEALRTFQSVRRRLEIRAEIDGITIIDDFAHHPTAIRETLRALRSAYPGRRLWAVLEPRSNTLRRNVFEKELIDSLALADQIVLAAVFHSEKIPAPERLHPENVVSALQTFGRPATLHENADAIVTNLVPQLVSGDVVAILSNGGFDGIYQKLPVALEARTAKT
jgi:UDP-N-acetylmuramate: L-alanyl-gamma-D-glutamyl-meso-diaminopimelate ligase